MKAKTKPAAKSTARATAPAKKKAPRADVKAFLERKRAEKIAVNPNLAAACPSCQAKAGQWCKRPSGHPAMTLHADRVKASAEIAKGAVLRPAARLDHALELAPKPLDLDGLKAPGKLESIDPTKIELNPHNPRRVEVEDEAQRTFEESIATQGILEPVLVRPVPVGGVGAGRQPYQLVAGERRFKAALKAIQAKRLPVDYRIPAMVKGLDNRQARLAALAENLARADMHPLDECREFAAAEDAGSSPAEIAKATGANLRNVQRRIKVWRDLPEDGKTAMREPRTLKLYGGSKAWTLSFSQAHAIAQVAEPKVRARVLKEVLEDYNPPRCNEDWIKRRADSLERQRKQREADKKNPKSAAKRKAEHAAIYGTRSHERKREFPKPDAAGLFAWPKENAGYRDGVDHRKIKGSVVTLELVAMNVDEKRQVVGFRVKAGPLQHEEPLRLADAKPDAGDYGKDGLAVHERRALDYLIDRVLGEPKPLPSLDRRKVAADVAAALDPLVGAAYNDQQRQTKAKLLERLHDKLLQVLAPPASAPAPAPTIKISAEPKPSAQPPADPRAAGPIAAPVDVPGKKPEIGPRLLEISVTGMRLAAAMDHEHSRTIAAKDAGMPDYVIVEARGRFFAYAFNGERGVEKPAKAKIEKAPPAKAEAKPATPATATAAAAE